ENTGGIDAGLPISIRQVRAVAHQTAGRREVAPFIDRRQSVARRQHDDLLMSADEEWRGADQKRSRISRTRVEKAVSKSFSTFARTKTSCTPKRGAASSSSRSWACAAEKSGLISAPMRLPLGTTSCSSPSRLPSSPLVN